MKTAYPLPPGFRRLRKNTLLREGDYFNAKQNWVDSPQNFIKAGGWVKVEANQLPWKIDGPYLETLIFVRPIKTKTNTNI